MDLIKIGKYIAGKRKDLGMTQRQLADKLNMSDKSISKWERGVCLPDVSVYLDLCQILGISPNELLGWEAAPGGNYAAHIGGSNTQNSTEAITALSAQLKEKDRQIDRLLKIVEKGKKQ